MLALPGHEADASAREHVLFASDSLSLHACCSKLAKL